MPPQSPADRRAAAKAEATKGRDAAAVGQFTQAIRAFKRAYRLVPNPDYLFDLAQAYRRNGDLNLALEKYELYLSVQRRGPRASKARKFIKLLKKSIKRRGGPGRRGHAKCPQGQWLWGGSCSPTTTFTSMARRKSRMFFGTQKDCPPGFKNRSGTYCYVCPSGKYWNTGGSCTYSCSGSKDFTERKCKAGGVVGGVGGGSRKGHAQCPSGQWEWGGSCTPTSRFTNMAKRKSRMFFGTHKACPPGFLNRSGTYCYVCPSGRYWTSGGSCVSSCSGGTDYSERKCKLGLGLGGGVITGGGTPTVGGTTPRKFGHNKCGPGKWEWGGSCDAAPYYYKLAQRRSRIYFSQSKSCPPGLTYRSGNHCYVCPSGKFWNKGGSCTYSCSSGSKNYTERSCKGGGGVVGGVSGGSTKQGYSVGRTGHTKCAVGKWLWGGSCDPASYFTNLAKRRSRIFMGSGKTCVPGLSYRSGNYCYVCPSGKFWNTGGGCTYSCSGGKNYSERKCNVGGSSSSSASRRGHESCPVGQYKWGGKCDPPSYFYSLARRRSRIYFASGKACPPGLSHRSSTYCYVCPSGKFWNRGGSCTYSCSSGKNYSERKCR